MALHFRKAILAAGFLAFMAPESAVAQQQGSAMTVLSALNLRTAPSINASIITAMPRGAAVHVYGRAGNWCHVSWRQFSGYASCSYLGAAHAYAPPPVVRGYSPYRPRPGFSLFIGGDSEWRRYPSHRRYVGRDRGRYVARGSRPGFGFGITIR